MIVCATVSDRVSLRYLELKLTLQMYSPLSFGRSIWKVRVAWFSLFKLPFLRVHRNLLSITSNALLPLTSHVKEYSDPSFGCSVAVITACSPGGGTKKTQQYA